MISIVVEVTEPFKVIDGRPPLLPGVFAEVLIQGNTLDNAVAVPRDAIREGGQVWLLNGNRLRIRSLKIVRLDKKFAYVASDVLDSSLDAVVDDMEVRTEANVTTQDEQVKNNGVQTEKPEDN